MVAGGLYFNAGAQTATALQNSFDTHAQNTLQEKLFVHTDKSVYLAGELLWFKIYCVNALTHKPLDLSKVAYVDISDKNNTPVLQAKIALKHGSGAGSIYMPVNIANGNYRLRAYTNWMKNNAPDLYFEKIIEIVNPQLSVVAGTKTAATPAFDIQFFPEGGSLVAGFTNKIAFKATDADGRGLAAYTGAVINQNNDTVARFKPFKFGIGSFSFIPVAGNTYKAVVKTANAKAATAALPAVSATGYALHLTDNGSGPLQVNISSGNNGTVYLFGHTRGQAKILQTALLSNNSATFSIDREKLGEGVSSITIFNENKQPVAERLYFKQPGKKLFIDATPDAQLYSLRKRAGIDISAKDAAGKAQLADLSMSVYRVDSLQGIDNENIYSYLWLRSDLEGNIESPAYYFNGETTETREALDNLMLSQGWRRFKWNEVTTNKAPVFKFLPEYNGHLVTASINSKDNKPVKDAIAYMGIPGKFSQMYAAKSDSIGRLIFNTHNFYGPGEIVVQTNRMVDSVSKIEVNSPFSEEYSKWALPAFGLNDAARRSVEEHNLSMQSLNIYAGNKLKIFAPVADSTRFFDKPDKSYLLDNYTRFATLEEVFREYVPEVDITKRGNDFFLRTISKNGFLPDPPLVLLDGVPVFNTTKIIGIDPLKIYKLQNVRDTYYWGPAKHDGIVNLFTYKGDLAGVEMDPNAVVIDYEGMQLQREFYAPMYDTEARAKSHLPDFRNLLYWQPSIITGAQSNKLSFYTSDLPGTYIGLVQGIDANGNAAAKYFKFEVKK